MPNHRTSDHIFTLTTLINTHVQQNNNKTYSCFVDFQKAFDSIWHSGLYYQLLKSGIGAKTYDLIKTMYSNNRCAIKIGNKRTNYFKQQRGVKQGCNMSPTLFNIYINTFAEQLQKSTAPGVTLQDTEVKCLMFADDLVLLSSSKEGLQQSLDILHKFSQTWALSINMDKTKILTFQKRSNSQKNKFTLGTTEIEHTKNYRYLGLILSSTGHFGLAVNELKEKARRAFYAIKRKIPIDIPIRTWLKILNAIIDPIILYGSEIWGPLTNQTFPQWEKHPVEALHAELCKIIL